MTGPLLVADHFVELAAVLVLLLVVLVLGLATLDLFDMVALQRPLASLLASLLLGLGVYASGILLLGLAGFLRPWWLGLSTVAIAVLLRARFRDVLILVRRFGEQARSRWDLVAFGFVGLVAACLLVQASAPPTDWDSLIYHLEVPRAWWAEGRIHLPADNLHAAFTGLLHLLYVPLLALDAPSGPAVLNAVLGGALALALFEFGDRFFDRATGRIAAVALFGTPAVLLVAMTARVDVSVILFLVVGLYAVYVNAFGEADETEGWVGGRGLYLAAALLGLATSVKLVAVPWIVTVAPLALWGVIRISETPSAVPRTVGLAGGAFLLGAAPGLVLRWHLAGAPLYPAISPRLLEPWLQPWYEGARHLPVDAALAPRAGYTRDPVSLSALLTDPGTLTPEREGALYFPGPILWLTPLVLLHLKRRKATGLAIVALVFLAMVLSVGERTNLRYLLPAAVVLTLLGAHLLVWMFGKLGPSPLSHALIGIFLVFAVAPTALPFAFRWTEMPTLGHLAGAVSTEEYLSANDDPDVYLWGRTVRWLDGRVGPGDRILLLFEGRGFQLEGAKIQDNLMANWPLLAQRRKPGDCLARAGITHVLVNYGVLDVHMDHGMPPSTVAWHEFPRFARECLEREAVHRPYTLYRVIDGNGEPSNADGYPDADEEP